MKFTRRNFIQTSAVAVLATTLGHAAGRDTGLFDGGSEKRIRWSIFKGNILNPSSIPGSG